VVCEKGGGGEPKLSNTTCNNLKGTMCLESQVLGLAQEFASRVLRLGQSSHPHALRTSAAKA